MQQVRLGIIGAGFMGTIHGRVARQFAGVEVTAIADVDRSRAAQLAADTGAGIYTEYAEMLRQETLDAVVVATPEFDHRRPVEAAAAAGCHVLVEKPLASSLADADAMIAACAAADVLLMTAFVLRFEACYAAIHQAVTEGQLGRLLSMYARRNATIEEGRRLHGRTSVINYLAVHDVDQMLWYLPERQVTQVYAKALSGRLQAEVGVPDFSWLMLEFDDGTLGVVECGWAMTEGWGGFTDVKMNVIGAQGVMQLDFNPMNLVRVTHDQGWTFPETRHWPVVNDRLGGAASAGNGTLFGLCSHRASAADRRGRRPPLA